MADFRSRATLSDAVHVRIVGRRRAPEVRGQDLPRFETADDELALKFLRWLVEHPEVERIEGSGGGSGLGNFDGTFYAEHRPAIEEFFRSQEVKVRG